MIRYAFLLLLITACTTTPDVRPQPNAIRHAAMPDADAVAIEYRPSGSYCYTCQNCTLLFTQSFNQEAIACSCGDGDGGYKVSVVNLETSLRRQPQNDLIVITNDDGILKPKNGGNSPITPIGTFRINNQICGDWYKDCVGANLVVSPVPGTSGILNILSMSSTCEGQESYLPIQGNCKTNKNGDYTVKNHHGQLYCDN